MICKFPVHTGCPLMCGPLAPLSLELSPPPTRLSCSGPASVHHWNQHETTEFVIHEGRIKTVLLLNGTVIEIFAHL